MNPYAANLLESDVSVDQYDDVRLTLDNDFCINTGTEHFAGSLKDVLKRKRNWDDAKVESEFIYQNVAAVELPINDVVYADRVQDCQIDIGAYEFDGTQEIKPGYELIAFDPERPDDRELCAVYYVNKAGGGLATGESYDNAACERKLQHILDAAGRLKYDLNAGTDSQYWLAEPVKGVNCGLILRIDFKVIQVCLRPKFFTIVDRINVGTVARYDQGVTHICYFINVLYG